MQIANISRYRTEIMGISILWIVLYHSTQLNFGSTPFSLLVNSVKAVGYGGADLFFFLSGFGLVFGWLHKKYKVPEFYRKRLFRILPTYFTALLLYAIFHLTYFRDFRVRGFVADLLGVGFLTSRSYNYWFVPSIILCYLIFPAIISLLTAGIVKKGLLDRFWSIILLSSCLPLVLCLVAILAGKYQLLIFLTRLPNFILGVVIGFLYSEDKMQDSEEIGLNFLTTILASTASIWSLWIVNSFADVGFSWSHGLLWYPFILLAFPLILTLALSFNWLDSKFPECFKLPKKGLFFCGIHSLEIYLSHIVVFDFYNDSLSFVGAASTLLSPNQISALTYLLLIGSSLIMAFSIKKFTSLLS